MTDFAQARANMVDCQIHTNGVISPDILNAFETLPREKFVPKELQDIAYFDEDLSIGNGRFLLEPITHAKMLQALDPEKDSVILDVGCALGYSAAVLSNLATTVIALEEDGRLLKKAEKLWNELDACNVVGLKGNLKDGDAENAPYDYICVNGAVANVPEALVAQLAVGGKMVVVVRPDPNVLGHATLIYKNNEESYSSNILFEAGCPYLSGFEPKASFVF